MPDDEKIEQEAAVIDADANVDEDLKADADADANADDSQKETAEKKSTIFETIKNIIRRKPDDGTADDDSDGGDVDGSTAGKDIPAQFTEAAIVAGMSTEQISEFASDYDDAELLEQIPTLKAQVSENSDESEQLSKKEAGDTQKDAGNKDGESTDDAKDEEIRLLKARLDKVEKGQLQNSEKEVQNQLVSRATAANKLMDELSKEFEIFGTYKTLPRFPHNKAIIPTSPQARARNEVWWLADDLHIKAGMDFDTALNISLDAFKGKNLAADVKRNLVKDLKRSETRLSAKRSSHEAVKTDLSGPDVIRSVGHKHGLEIR